MGDLELTQRQLGPLPRARCHLQGGRRFPTGKMSLKRRESLTLVSISSCRHGDRRSHAAPPLPHNVAPPPPNPEARGSRPLRGPFGKGERGGPGSPRRAPRPSEAGPPARPHSPLRLRVLSAPAAGGDPGPAASTARVPTGRKSRLGEEGKGRGGGHGR